MSSPSTALQTAMRDRLLAHAPLMALLGGGHVHDEIPRGAHEPYVVFSSIETRDWGVQQQKAHEHFIAIDIKAKGGFVVVPPSIKAGSQWRFDIILNSFLVKKIIVLSR